MRSTDFDIRKVKDYARRLQSYVIDQGRDSEYALGNVFSMGDFLDWCVPENDVFISDSVKDFVRSEIVDGMVDLERLDVMYGNSSYELFEGSGMLDRDIEVQLRAIGFDVYVYFAEYAIYVVGKEDDLNLFLPVWK